MKRLIVFVAGAALASACGSTPESFEPSERATAYSLDGHPAADYKIEGSDGEVGEVKVWSRGTYRKDGQTVLHVGFDIDNSGEHTLTFDPSKVALESGRANSRELQTLHPARLEGTTTIAPEANETVEAYFSLPAGISPQEMDAFRVRWSLGDGVQTYAQRTPFLEVEDLYQYYGYPYGLHEAYPYWRNYYYF